MRELLRRFEGSPFRLRQTSATEDLRKVFREVGRRGEANLLLDVPTGRLRDYLAQAQQVGMLTEYHNYIATSVDLHRLDLRQFYSSRCNLTAFHLVDTRRSLPKNLNHQLLLREESLDRLSPWANDLKKGAKVRKVKNEE